MAIDYNGTNMAHYHAAGLGTTFTLSLWLKRNAGSTSLVAAMVRIRGNQSKLKDQFEGITLGFDDLVGGGPSGGNKPHAVTYKSSIDWAAAAATTTLTQDVWYHVAATFHDGSNERNIWVNGAQEASNNSGVGAVASNQLSYAVLKRTTNTRWANIEIAEPAMWAGVTLATPEMQALAAGASPIEVQPVGLSRWARNIAVPPYDMTGAAAIAAIGSPTSSPHAPVSEMAVAVG